MFYNFASFRLTCPVFTDNRIQTLKASRAVQNQIYRYHVGPRYLQHFKHIIFDESSDLIGLDYLAASLDSFTNLKQLTLSATSAKATFGSGRDSISASFATRRLARINGKIRTLHLRDFEAADAITYLTIFKSVREVSLRGPFPASPKDVGKLASVLRNVDALSLDLGGKHSPPFSLPRNFAETSHEWPRLRSLTLDIEAIDQTTISFIQIFSSSLEELKVTTFVEVENVSDLVAFPAEVPFPRLQRISLVGTHAAARTVFEKTSTQTFPALDHVHLSYVSYNPFGFGQDDSNLHSLFEQHRFRFLQYDPPEQGFRLEDAENIRELAFQHDVQVTLRDYPWKTTSTFLGDEDTAEYIQYEQNSGRDLSVVQTSIEEDLERIKDYLETTMAQLSESEDVPALYRLLTFLRPLELEQFAMLD